MENLVSAKWLERQIMELEEELECPVCLEVAIDPPIFKWPSEVPFFWSQRWALLAKVPVFGPQKMALLVAKSKF